MNTDEVKAVLREVYKRQGYVVIGQSARATAFGIGATIRQVFNYDFGTEFEVTDSASREDYTAQDDLIAQLRPEWKRELDPRFANGEGRFFRLKPVMR